MTPSPTTLTFTTANWQTARTVTVTAGDDADTTDDTVALTHSAASADGDYSGIAIAGVTVTVEDDDTAGPVVRFGASSYAATEGGRGTTVTVALSEAAGSAVTIPLTRTHRGGATNADYSGVPPNVRFGASETTRTFTVTAVDDSANDDGESVRIGFGSLPSGVTEGSPATATVALDDNDGGEPLTVSFGAATYTATEGGSSATVTVRLNRPAPTGFPFSVRLETTRQGGATSADHSHVPDLAGTFTESRTRYTFTVTATDDTHDDDGESLLIRFGHPLVVGSVANEVRVGTPSETTVRLVDDDQGYAEGGLRLVAPVGSDEGQLQVYHDDRWGLVCDTNFDRKDAKVACRQLGYADGQVGYGGSGTGGLPFWLNYLHGAGEYLVGDLPDPACAVAQHDARRGRSRGAGPRARPARRTPTASGRCRGWRRSRWRRSS